MSNQSKENYKRLVNRLHSSNSTRDDKDIVRFGDLDKAIVLSGSGLEFFVTDISDIYLVNSSGIGTKTLFLPEVANGRQINIKDKFGDAGTNNIVMIPFGSNTIDGLASGIIDNNYGALTLYFDDTEWSIL